ncbi:MAG: glycosyl hydrolase, partial [Acidimicrobiia bacterium]
MKHPQRRITLLLSLLIIVVTPHGAVPASLAANFATPPASARPWVFWFWINGNISKAGITADLEAMQRAGIGGVLWMEVSGPWWAPEGPMVALSPQWHEAMQWAFRECERLGLEFDLSVDFGYGSGGPHITPDRSMQKLYWSELEVEGGTRVKTPPGSDPPE